MAKKKEDKKLTKDQAEKKILTLKKDLFNIRFKKITSSEITLNIKEIKKPELNASLAAENIAQQ